MVNVTLVVVRFSLEEMYCAAAVCNIVAQATKPKTIKATGRMDRNELLCGTFVGHAVIVRHALKHPSC